MADKIKHMILQYAVWILILLDIIFVVQSFFYVFRTDLIQCDYGLWISHMKKSGFLSIYHVGSNGLIESDCNYPPIYIYFLWLVMRFDQGIDSSLTTVLFKICPFVFFFASQYFVYTRVSKEAALSWTMNIAFILNFAVWGQRDVAFGFLLIGMFYSFYKEQIYAPSIWFAVMCLLKPQGCLFLPCYLIYMYGHKSAWKTKLVSVSLGAGLGVLTYLPFIIHEGTPRVFFDVYLTSSDKYFFSLNTYAPNLYFWYNECAVADDWFWLVSVGFMLYSVFTLFLVYKRTQNLFFASMAYAYIMFMVSPGQHERYALYYIFFIFFMYYVFGQAYSKKFRKNLFRVYILSSLAAFIGQFVFVLVTEPLEAIRVKYGFPFTEVLPAHADLFFDYCSKHPILNGIYTCRTFCIFIGTILNIVCGYILYKKLYPEVKKCSVQHEVV